MSHSRQFLSRFALLTLILPLLLGADDATDEKTFVQPDHDYEVVTVRIAGVSKKKLVVERINLNGGARERIDLVGHRGVAVSGKKGSWLELRKGDLASVTYERDTKQVVKIDVMKWTDHPAIAQTTGLQRTRKPGRVFMGWVKLKTEDTLVVRTPDAPSPDTRKGTVMRFERQEDTVVEKLRDSWSEVKKGDRVRVVYGKGRPRPAERVMVTLKGGERPLPPGLPSRLYDPEFDESVKDVDGIGEVAPGEKWQPATTADAS